MSHKTKDLEQKEVIQAVVVADNFDYDFSPITNDIPLALLPLVNIPLIDYTLEFLSLGGIDETFLFCCSHAELIKAHIQRCIEAGAGWVLTMKVNIIVSESCRSFGDCLRDLDAKGLIRGDFVLLEAGTVGNIKLLPLIKKHSETAKFDRDAVMTLLLQEVGAGQCSYESEQVMIASCPRNRILFHKKRPNEVKGKIDLPLQIFIEQSRVSIRNDLKDTHIAICSPSVLMLFSDNFDYQTKDDFIRGILMSDEIMENTIYWHNIKDNQYGAGITNWRMYQNLSHDLIHRWVYPLVLDMGISAQERIYAHLRNNIYKTKSTRLDKNSQLVEDVVLGCGTFVADNTTITKSVIGDKVKIGRGAIIENSYIFSNSIIDDKCIITHSIIGPNCSIKVGSKITAGSVVGTGVVIPKSSFVEDALIQAEKPINCDPGDKLGEKAYKLKHHNGNETDSDEGLVKQLSRLHLDVDEESDNESIISTESEDDISYRDAPDDDTNLFLNEVIDSLARGFEDKLHCDNLVLEINSSRYAYNVTVNEVNFHVVKAILTLPFQLYAGQSYLRSLRSLLSYFSPILKKYIRNEGAMLDCLQAIEDMASAHDDLNECLAAILNWFYDEDYLSEECIVKWFESLDPKNRLCGGIAPFIKWLEEAEEASDDDD